MVPRSQNPYPQLHAIYDNDYDYDYDYDYEYGHEYNYDHVNIGGEIS